MKQNFLRIPSDTMQEEYHSFSQDNEIPWQQTRKTQSEVLQTPRESGGGGNPGYEDMTNNPEEDQDPFVISNTDEIIMAIQGWVKLFVQHLHAKSVLESFAKQGEKGIPIEIKVCGISPPEPPLPMPTWEALKDIIWSSLKDKTDEEKNSITNVFLGHIGGDPSGRNKIFHVFSDIINEKATPRRYYNMHCEAALVGLVAASEVSKNIASYGDEEMVTELCVGLVHFLQPRQLTHIYRTYRD